MVSSFFSRSVAPFVTGISRTLKIAGIEMLVRFFCTASQTAMPYTPVPEGTHSGRPPEAFEGSGYLPVFETCRLVS